MAIGRRSFLATSSAAVFARFAPELCGRFDQGWLHDRADRAIQRIRRRLQARHRARDRQDQQGRRCHGPTDRNRRNAGRPADPGSSVQNMRRVLDNKDVVGLFCPSGSGPTLAVIDMITADGRPTMQSRRRRRRRSSIPGGPGSKPRPNVYTFSIQNDIEANFMAAILGKKFTRIGLMNESTGYGKTGGELIKAGITKVNKDATVTHESYNQKDQDMTAQLVRVQRARSEVLMVVGLGADMAVIRKNMTRMNMTIPLYVSAGGFSPPYLEGAGDLAVGTKGSQFRKISTVPPAPRSWSS